MKARNVLKQLDVDEVVINAFTKTYFRDGKFDVERGGGGDDALLDSFYADLAELDSNSQSSWPAAAPAVAQPAGQAVHGSLVVVWPAHQW